MPIKNLEYWLMAQMALEAGLIVLVVFFWFRIRTWRKQASPDPDAPSRTEVQKMAIDLASLEKKRFALEEVVEQLSLKVAQMQKHLNILGSQEKKSYSPPLSWESGVSLRAQVEALDRQGLSLEEIARRLQMNLAEVKVALDLSRVRPA